ncbi:hypothetical protein GCM10011494_10060 [Novosphingobium endophyticum]|uniref:Uncharacterized protein n=1 Tax=Novosphingobium endophyticum TaxID=1955250 RepID=A0A916TQ70_9SPHN|nr:hypothetical protein [Novosphingobium endophyticum]GGB93630.1 hypothetical protein GCM10011494_10060 [Novosphingobium endophyticum]
MAEPIQHEPGTDGAVTPESVGGTADIARAGTTRGTDAAKAGDDPLFPPGDAQELQTRWEAIQASFVDEPRRAVEEADTLVAGAMKLLAETFAQERFHLEEQWDRGGDVTTEDLRIALKRYRAFFGRLLAI